MCIYAYEEANICGELLIQYLSDRSGEDGRNAVQVVVEQSVAADACKQSRFH